MIFRFRKGIFLAGFACCEMKTLTLLTLFCPSLLHFTTILYCQNVLANVPSRQSGFRHRHRRLAKPPSRAQPFHPSPSPSLQPIPSRSFNKARDRSVGRSTRHLLRRANPTRESRSPIATAAKLAPPQFRGTWQPNRPYTLRLRKGRGNGRRGRGRGEGGSIAI